MSRRRGRAICAGIRAGVSIVPPSPRPREKWRRTVRKRLGRWLTVGILVVGILVGTVVLALSETTYKDPCAADRDLFAFSLTSDGTSLLQHQRSRLDRRQRERVRGAVHIRTRDHREGLRGGGLSCPDRSHYCRRT